MQRKRWYRFVKVRICPIAFAQNLLRIRNKIKTTVGKTEISFFLFCERDLIRYCEILTVWDWKGTVTYEVMIKKKKKLRGRKEARVSRIFKRCTIGCRAPIRPAVSASMRHASLVPRHGCPFPSRDLRHVSLLTALFLRYCVAQLMLLTRSEFNSFIDGYCHLD